METALNLVWLAVSAALLLIGSAQVIHAGKDRSRGMAAVAMVCLICLLFPVISMTDDLNSGSLALLEPNKIKHFLSLASVAAVLLPWLSLQLPTESFNLATSRSLFEEKPAAQELPSFHLNRRPPPSLS